MINLSPQQRAVFSRVLARCNDCEPLIEFLEKIGQDVQELKDRVALQREQSETALALLGVQNGKK